MTQKSILFILYTTYLQACCYRLHLSPTQSLKKLFQIIILYFYPGTPVNLTPETLKTPADGWNEEGPSTTGAKSKATSSPSLKD